MRKLLIAVIVLVGLLVAADRVALLMAEQQASKTIATSFSLPQRPGVSIHGFPFLTQLVSGQFQQVDVTMDSLVRNGVTVQNLDAKFTSVHAPVRQMMNGGAGSVSADQATGTATVPYSAVNQQLPQGVTVSGDGGKLKMSGSISMFGHQVPFSSDASVTGTGNGIRISPSHVNLDGQAAPDSSLGPLTVNVPIANLPMHLTVNSAQPAASGLQVSVSAQNVQVEGP